MKENNGKSAEKKKEEKDKKKKGEKTILKEVVEKRKMLSIAASSRFFLSFFPVFIHLETPFMRSSFLRVVQGCEKGSEKYHEGGKLGFSPNSLLLFRAVLRKWGPGLGKKTNSANDSSRLFPSLCTGRAVLHVSVSVHTHVSNDTVVRVTRAF